MSCFLTAASYLALAVSYSPRFLSHLLRSSSPYLGVALSTSMSPQVLPRESQTLPLPTFCILASALAASASISSRLVGHALSLKVWHLFFPEVFLEEIALVPSLIPVASAALSCLCPSLSWLVSALSAALIAALEASKLWVYAAAFLSICRSTACLAMRLMWKCM